MFSLEENDGSFTVLGLDPGSKNFAYSKIKAIPYQGANPKDRTLKIEVLETGILKYTVSSTRTAKSELLPFLSEVGHLIENPTSKCNAIGIEQYQTRGVGNKLIEIVNIMIGALMASYISFDIGIFTAAAWKVSAKKKFDLDAEYKKITCTPHELDATYIAIFKAFQHAGIPVFLGYKPKMFYKIARNVEKVSTTPKRTRRLK